MWIIFAAQADSAAQWLARGLVDHGLSPLEWVAMESLPRATLWSHSVGGTDVSVEVELEDGRRFHSREVRGVINRIRCIPEGHLVGARPADRSYIRQELSAFYLSWLTAFSCPVLNPAHPQGMAGALRHPSEWRTLAARAGLPCPPCHYSSRQPPEAGWQPLAGLPAAFIQSTRMRLYVVGSEVVAAGQPLSPPSEVRSGCNRLAKLSETLLLGIDFALDESGRWYFLSADPSGDVTAGGDPLLTALARFFLDGDSRRRRE